jgi:hypothetical protein
MATVCKNTMQASTTGSGKCHHSRAGVWLGRTAGGGQGRIWGSLQDALHHATRASQAVCTPKWQQFVRTQCSHQPQAAGSATIRVLVCGWRGKSVAGRVGFGGHCRVHSTTPREQTRPCTPRNGNGLYEYNADINHRQREVPPFACWCVAGEDSGWRAG